MQPHFTSQTVLQNVFGYQQFRQGQQEVIEATLAGKDTLVIMTTGGGKSLCYQVPALCLEGITLVISPLISLMKDQVDQLLTNGIEAGYLNSSQTLEEQRAIEQKSLIWSAEIALSFARKSDDPRLLSLYFALQNQLYCCG